MKTGGSISLSVAGKILRQEDYVLEVCPQTGLLRRAPTLNDEDLAFYYAHNDWKMHSFSQLFPTERLLRRELLCLLPEEASVLDIGCGDGRFLSYLPESFRKYGTELSSGAADAAKSKGISVVSHESVIAGQHGLFDAIVLIDVFEHLRDPHEFLSSLIPCLKPGGFIGLCTGDGDYCLGTPDPAAFWYWRIPVHLCMMTERYALYAERELGLARVSSLKSSHYPFNLKQWVKQFAQSLLFEFWHDGKHGWITSLAKALPAARKARLWQTRPKYSYGCDHTVMIWRNSKSVERS